MAGFCSIFGSITLTSIGLISFSFEFVVGGSFFGSSDFPGILLMNFLLPADYVEFDLRFTD